LPVANTSRYGVIARETPAHLLGSAIIGQLTQEVWAPVPAVLGGDPKATHDMRVALRRLRNALETFGLDGKRADARRFVKAARRLGKRLGAVRDADVHLTLLRKALAPAPAGDAPGIAFAIESIATRRTGDLSAIGPAIEAFARLRPAGLEVQ
jgi:CHAD domain-containing protein